MLYLQRSELAISAAISRQAIRNWKDASSDIFLGSRRRTRPRRRRGYITHCDVTLLCERRQRSDRIATSMRKAIARCCRHQCRSVFRSRRLPTKKSDSYRQREEGIVALATATAVYSRRRRMTGPMTGNNNGSIDDEISAHVGEPCSRYAGKRTSWSRRRNPAPEAWLPRH